MQIIYVYHNSKDDTYKGLIQATAEEISAMDKNSNQITVDSNLLTMCSGSVIQCVDDISKTLILFEESEWR